MTVRFLPLLICAASLQAEIYTLTLKQAVDRALKENPDIALARLDEQRAFEGVRLARDPFTTRVGIGSGLAYNNGFPFSGEGSGPSVFQARASQSLFNRQQSYFVAQARENARTAGFATGSKRDEIAFRTASLYLDADRARRLSETTAKAVDSLEKVAETVRNRVAEGRDLPIETKRAALNTMRARQRAEAFFSDRDFAERSLAVVLGYTPDDRVRTAADERAPVTAPATEKQALESALASNNDLRRLESALLAKGLETRAQKAAAMPRVDLVAQYGMFAKFNHYDEYYRKFQRHNGQLGVSFQLPILPGSGPKALVRQAETDAARLRVEMTSARNRIALDIHQGYQDLAKAGMASEVARADLDLARENLSLVLAQMQEGRAPLRQVEETRYLENEKWIAFYDAQFALERARFSLLRQTGDLVASLQ